MNRFEVILRVKQDLGGEFDEVLLGRSGLGPRPAGHGGGAEKIHQETGGRVHTDVHARN